MYAVKIMLFIFSSDKICVQILFLYIFYMNFTFYHRCRVHTFVKVN